MLPSQSVGILKEILCEVLSVELKLEAKRIEIAQSPDFNDISVFQRIAGNSQRRHIRAEDISKYLTFNSSSQSFFDCLLFVQRYAIPTDEFLRYNEFMNCVMPALDDDLIKAISLRPKREFEEVLPPRIEVGVAELIAFEIQSLSKIDGLKGQLRDSASAVSPQKCFEIIDQDKMGFLDADAIRNFIARSGQVIEDSKMSLLLRHIARANTRRVSPSEFVRFLQRHQPQRERNETQQQTTSYRKNPEEIIKKYKKSTENVEKESQVGNTASSFYSQTAYQPNSTINKPKGLNLSLSSVKKRSTSLVEKFPEHADIYKVYDTEEELSLPEGLKSSKQNWARGDKVNEKMQSIGCKAVAKIDDNNLTSSSIVVAAAAINSEQNKKRSSKDKSNDLVTFSTSKDQIDKLSESSNIRSSSSSVASKQSRNSNSSKRVTNKPSKIIEGFLKDLAEMIQEDKQVEAAKADFLISFENSPEDLFDQILESRGGKAQQGLIGSDLRDFITSRVQGAGKKALETTGWKQVFSYFDADFMGMVSRSKFVQRFKPIIEGNAINLRYDKKDSNSSNVDCISEATLNDFCYTQDLSAKQQTAVLKFFQTIVNSHHRIASLKIKYTQPNPTPRGLPSDGNVGEHTPSLIETFNILDVDRDTKVKITDLVEQFDEAKIAFSVDDRKLLAARFAKQDPSMISFVDFITEFTH